MRHVRSMFAACLVGGLLLVAAPVHADPIGPGGNETPPDGACPGDVASHDFSDTDLRRWILRHAGGWRPFLSAVKDLANPAVVYIGQNHDLLADPATSRAELAAINADYDALLAGTATQTDQQAVALFELDLTRAMGQVRDAVPAVDQFAKVRVGVLLDMVFYHGAAQLQGRPALLAALAAGDFMLAGDLIRDYLFAPVGYYDRHFAWELMQNGFTCEADPGYIPGVSVPQPQPVTKDALEYPPSDGGTGKRILSQLMTDLGAGGGGGFWMVTVRYSSSCSANVNYGATTSVLIDCGSFAVEVQIVQP